MKSSNSIDLATFQALPTAAVAERVRAAGPKVCVFPINGTRRWFALEHPDAPQDYVHVTWERQVELYKLFFEHGIDTLVTPIYGPELLERGEAYARLVIPGMKWFTEAQKALAFYDEWDVRVRVYGDAQRYMAGSPYETLLQDYDRIASRTAAHRTFRLFFGVCAHDATETVAEIGAQFCRVFGRLPNRQEIVAAYYGEYVAPADLFIGFDRPAVFDMPLLATGSEDLYFTVAPSPYMDRTTLRAILYDHLYTRRVSESSYDDLTAEDWQAMAAFYDANRHAVLGLGSRKGDNFWHPIPQVKNLLGGQ